MREIRLSGSEGGGNGTTGPPYPYQRPDSASVRGHFRPRDTEDRITMNMVDIMNNPLARPGEPSSPTTCTRDS
jgi:hypothetical protein